MMFWTFTRWADETNNVSGRNTVISHNALYFTALLSQRN